MARRCWTYTRKSSFRGWRPIGLPRTAPPSGRKWWPCSTAWPGPRRCPARLSLPTSPPGPGMPPPSAGRRRRASPRGPGRGPSPPAAPSPGRSWRCSSTAMPRPRGKTSAARLPWRDTGTAPPWPPGPGKPCSGRWGRVSSRGPRQTPWTRRGPPPGPSRR